MADSRESLPRGADLVLQPWLDDGEVNPPQAFLRWEEPVHRVEFRIRAAPGADGRRIRGGVRVFSGIMVVAEVSFRVFVDSAAPPGAAEHLEPLPLRRFRQIFASYSRADASVVAAVASYAGITGDRYIIDTISLRCSEEWEPRLIELINDSDIFQLFWSRNAMESPQVRREWEHALSLRRTEFICPVFWEDPLPADPARELPPPAIGGLHWARLPIRPAIPSDSGQHTARVGPVEDRQRSTATAARPPAFSAAPVGSARTPPGSGEPPKPRRRRAGVVVAAAATGVALVGTYTGYYAWSTLTPASSSVAAPSTSASAPPAPPTETTDSAPPIVAASVPIPSIGATIPVGESPGFVVVAPNGRQAYIANRATGVVTVLDTAVNKVTATIPVAAGPPQYLSFSPDGRTVYVSIWNETRTIAAVGVLDTTTNTIVANISVRTRPFLAAVTPDGKQLYVPNHDSGTVSVIDTATNAVTTEFTVAANPHWVAFAKDGSRAYIASHESNLISIIDTSNNTVLAEVPVQTSPHSVAVHPNRPLVANVNYDSNSVTMIDTNTEQVIATIPVGQNPQDITWAPDGRFAYVANVNGNTVSVINAETMAVSTTIPVGNSPTSIGVLPNGSAAYVTNVGDGTVTVRNTAG